MSKQRIFNTFYCVYCNKEYSLKDPNNYLTKEHFIPASIGGKQTIPVCNVCNKIAGRTIDTYLARMAYVYGIYHKKHIIRTIGTAYLFDQTTVVGEFIYKDRNGGLQKFIVENKEYDKTKIDFIEVPIPPGIELLTSIYPSLAKIVLGGLYHSLFYQYHDHGIVQRKCNSNSIQYLRNIAFPNSSEMSPEYCEIQFSFLGRDKVIEIQTSFPHPEMRYHFWKIEQNGGNVILTFCLFSSYFFKVEIPNFIIGTNIIQPTQYPCKELDPVNLPNICNMQSQINKINIRICV